MVTRSVVRAVAQRGSKTMVKAQDGRVIHCATDSSTASCALES